MQVLLSVLVALLQAAGAAGSDASPSAAPAATVAPAAGAEEAPDTTAGLVAPTREVEELLVLWKVRQRAVADGDAARADELQKQILLQRNEAGVRRLDAFAMGLLAEAKAVATERNDSARAQQLVEQARQLSPDLPEIEAAQAEWVLARQPWALHRWLVFQIKSVVARLGDFQRRTLLLSDVLLTAFFVLSCLTVVFLSSQLLRHGLGLYHGLGRAFPALLKFLLAAVVLVVCAIPLVFGFGPLLLVYPFLLVLWPVQKRAEKALSVFVLAALAALPWSLRAVDRLTEAGTGQTQSLYALSINPASGQAYQIVASAHTSHPSDWQAAAALGLAHKRRGQVDRAIELLRQAEARVPPGTPEAGLVKNNLANAIFASGRTATAEKLYRQAIDLLPASPEPRFNLSRLYTRKARLEEARELFGQASAMAPDRVAQWNDDLDPNLNRYVRDLDFTADTLTRRELSTLLTPSPLSLRGWQRLAGPVPEATGPAASAAVLLCCVLMSVLRRRMQVVVPCSRCAQAAEVHLGAPETAPLCEQCHNLFVRNIPVDRRIRFVKEERIARVRTLRKWGLRISALVLPGLPSFLRGQPLRGALALGVVTLLLLRIAMPDGLLMEPFGGAPPTTQQVALLAGAAALVWLLGLVQAWRATREYT